SKGIVNCLRFAPDGTWLLAAGGANEGFLLLLDRDGKKTLRQEKVGAHIHDAVIDEKGETVILGGDNKVGGFEMKGCCAGSHRPSRRWRPRWRFSRRTCSEGRGMGWKDDFDEGEYPRLFEPDNLVPLVVMAVVGGLLFTRAAMVMVGWIDPF